LFQGTTFTYLNWVAGISKSTKVFKLVVTVWT